MHDKGKGIDGVSIGAKTIIKEHANWHPHWTIEKYDKNMKLYAVEEFDGNSLLNEGISEMLLLLIGSSAVQFNAANTYISVGDGTTAVAASQTGLQGTNKCYRHVDATYPQVSNQTAIFRATFGANDANYAWQEYSIANGSSDSAKNLNRRVEYHGVKVQGDTWVISLSVTIS